MATMLRHATTAAQSVPSCCSSSYTPTPAPSTSRTALAPTASSSCRPVCRSPPASPSRDPRHFRKRTTCAAAPEALQAKFGITLATATSTSAPPDGIVSAAAWVLVAGATLASLAATWRAYNEAKDALNQRDQFLQQREERGQRQEEERKERLKKMFDRL